MRKLIIAIDGPVGSGKSTTARRVAQLLGYTYLDSGAMYRALGLQALRRGVRLDSPAELEVLARKTRVDLKGGRGGLRVLLDGADVTEAIRSAEVSEAASKVAIVPGVRKLLVAEQRRAGERGGVVMEGRDIGTVVFPDADLKIYLDASVEARADRRWRETHAKGEPAEPTRIVEQVRERDQRDLERVASPLARAPDAVVVDNTAMDIDETARLIVLLAQDRAAASNRKGASRRRKPKSRNRQRARRK